MNKKTLYILALFLLNIGNYALGAKKENKPNLILIFVDDLGITDLGYTGSKYYQSPNIDRLAKEGMIFTEAYASAANCAPSRACLNSGQYGSRHGIYTVKSSARGKVEHRKLIPTENNTIIPDSVYTMAEILKDNGYFTCHAGKWHLSDDPTDHGFHLNIAGSHAGHPPGYIRPFSKKKKLPIYGEGPAGQYLTDWLTDEVVNFVDTIGEQPFFLNFCTFTVHGPIQAKEEKTVHYEHRKSTAAHNNPKYAAMIESLDENVAKLFAALEENGQLENSLIIFTSDNGGVYETTKQWPYRAGKGAYYEGGIREPMFALWPGVIEAGTECKTPVNNIDFYPTFLEAAGIQKDISHTLDGVSLVPLFKQHQVDAHPLFWHFPVYLQKGYEECQDPLFRCRPGSALRFGDWKVIHYYENDEVELYNLKTDIGEKHNLAKENPKKTKEMLSMLDEIIKETNSPIPTKLNPKYDADSEKLAVEKYYNELRVCKFDPVHVE